MKNKLVVVPSIAEPITHSPGFRKKGITGLVEPLAHWKLDLLALCGFGCSYCSSNEGNYLRINRRAFADLTEQQLGQRVLPVDDPSLSFVWPDVLDKLERQLARKPRTWGMGEILVFSMLTDGFSPSLVQDGTTRAALDLVLARTSFRIRILTKNAVVGSSEWIAYFLAHRDRFIVGLSTGTLDDSWAQRIEVGTSIPTARLRALRALQDAGVPTYGMLCPIFPGVPVGDLAEAIRPERCETVWAEPFNDRANWERVRDGHEPGSAAYQWFDRAFASGRGGWSRYAVDLYVRLRDIAERDGWIDKLCFLLYEAFVAASDAPKLAGFGGLSLQSASTDDGLSANAAVAEVQRGALEQRLEIESYRTTVEQTTHYMDDPAGPIPHVRTIEIVTHGEDYLPEPAPSSVDEIEAHNAWVSELHDAYVELEQADPDVRDIARRLIDQDGDADAAGIRGYIASVTPA